jgi:PAS domain S-box-containing protein
LIRKQNPVHDVPDTGVRVLLIDDDPVDRSIFKLCLNTGQPGTYEYAEAGTGREGLSLIEEFRPDCVLLDFHLPDLDGLAMIRNLLDRYEVLPCAVVMLTGIGSEKIAVEAMKLGVMDYLSKGPASTEALPRTVASAVQRFRLQQEIAEQRRALEQRNRELEEIRGQLFEEKERYRILAEAIPQLVWTADSDGFLQYGNQRLWEFSGKDPDEGCTLESLVHARDMGDLRDKWIEAIRSGRPFETELRLHRTHDDTWRWQLMRTTPIRATEEGPVRWFGTFTDIEDQKRAEEALREREKLDSIGLLAGGIAHDFNNILVGIMGGASFAIDSLEREHPAYPILEIVVRSSERAAHLTQQLLAYSGKGQTALEQVSISRVVREVRDLLRTSIPRNASVELDTAEDLPFVETSANRIQQLIINLVMNAVEAIGEETGVIKVRTATLRLEPANLERNVLGYRLPAGSYVLIEVSDSGVGMDEQTQTRIFDPFFTTKFTGRGLGLAAVQGIVRTLGGGIQVESELGGGSTFGVLLPAGESADSNPLDVGTADGNTSVVVITEDEDARRVATAVLRETGHDVIIGCVGMTNPDRIGLVIFDADTPGPELLDRMGALGPTVPVVVLTATDQAPTSSQFGGIEIADFIRKPISTRSLELCINNVLSGVSAPAVRGVRGRDGASA